MTNMPFELEETIWVTAKQFVNDRYNKNIKLNHPYKAIFKGRAQYGSNVFKFNLVKSLPNTNRQGFINIHSPALGGGNWTMTKQNPNEKHNTDTWKMPE